MRPFAWSEPPAFGGVGRSANSWSANPWVTVAAILVLVCWILLALCAPLLAPSAREIALLGSVERDSISLLPPLTRGHLVRVAGDSNRLRFVRADRAEIAGPNSPTPTDAVAAQRYWLGTDRIGRDLALAITRGAGTSLLIGLLAASLALTIGVGVGALAGLGNRTLDSILMRLVDAFLAFPLLLLVLVLDLLFDPGLPALIVILGSAQWMGVARIVRGEMLRLRNAPFILAARGIGARGVGLFLRHLLPNASRPILVSGLLLVGDSILLESAVSFLGFGTASDLDSWGRLVDSGRAFIVDAWWISTFPGIAIVLVVTAFNLLGDAHNQNTLQPF